MFMKSLSPKLTATVATATIVTAFMIAALTCSPTVPKNGGSDYTPPISAATDFVAPNVAAPRASAPTILHPVLRIGGKESPDVYLQSLDIQVEAAGNVAYTRHTMVFKNRTDRILEGELTFPLPDGRSVT